MSVSPARYFIILLFWCITTTDALSQKENNNWFFGAYGGVDFNSNPPQTVYNGRTYTAEGCASVSDPSGSLLFYTDGISVWDKAHNTMPNGTNLKGHTSTTQSAIIVRKPSFPNLYYIFNGDCYEDSINGIYYSVVDLSQNGGLGDVVQKNTVLLNIKSTEKITAVKDKIGCGFWIITHGYADSNFYSFRLTSLGIDTHAIVSSTGLNYAKNYAATIGHLKASPDGKKLAAALFTGGIEMYDFDNSTGIVSNGFAIDSTAEYYGVSFSPNSSVLYATSYSTHVLKQYDLSSNSPAAIKASAITIGNGNGTCDNFGALQIAPNGKIYLAKFCTINGRYYLGVINNPNTLGLSCNYSDTGQYISATTYFPYLGLPETVVNPVPLGFSLSLGSDKVVCNNPAYTIQQVQPLTGTFLWNTGDTTPTITVSAPGKYWLTSNSICGIEHDTINIDFVIDTAKVNFGPDTITCDEKYQLSAPYMPYAKYLWSTGDTVRNVSVKTNALYWLKVTAACGNRGDTIIIRFFKDSLPPVYIGKDTALCAPQYTLTADSVANASYLWSTNETLRTIYVKQSGTYWVKVSNYCFVKYDTISLQLIKDTVPPIQLGADTLMCFGAVLLYADSIPNARYLWATGDTTRHYNASLPGIYWVTSQTLCNTETDSITITYYTDSTKLFIGNDTQVCGSQLSLTANSVSMADYLWSTGDTTVSILADSSGLYWVAATTPCEIRYDTVFVTLIKDPLPWVYLGNDTLLCAPNLLLKDTSSRKGVSFLWSTGDTTESIVVDTSRLYWLEINNFCESQRDSVLVNFVKDSVTSINIGNDTMLCEGSIKLDAGFVPMATYKWNTGDTTQTITVNGAGNYSVELSTYVCNTKLRDTVSITYFTPTPLILTRDTVLCSGGITLNAGFVPMATYRWNTGDTTQTILVNNTGSYYVIVHTARCNHTQKGNVNVRYFKPNPLVLRNDTLVCEETFKGIVLKPGANYNSYLWSDGSTQPGLFALNEGIYSLTVSDSCANSYTDEVVLTVCDCRLYFPTAFTPNGDGNNDMYTVHNYCGMREYSIKIFNRWGILVFATDDPSKGWDGTFLGSPSPEGVYFMIIHYDFEIPGRTGNYMWNINLIR